MRRTRYDGLPALTDLADASGARGCSAAVALLGLACLTHVHSQSHGETRSCTPLLRGDIALRVHGGANVHARTTKTAQKESPEC